MEDTERIEGQSPEAEHPVEQEVPRVRAQRKKSAPKVTAAEKRLAGDVRTLTEQLRLATDAIVAEQKRAEAYRQQLAALSTYYEAAFATVSRHLGNVQETLSVLQFKGGDM